MKCYRNRRKFYVSRNEKWRIQIIILFVWTITEYSFLNHIKTESFVLINNIFVAKYNYKRLKKIGNLSHHYFLM